MLKTTHLAACIAATLTLSGCGLDDNNNSTTTNQISGKAADGYLSNAKVCVDINNNSQCDSDEPTTQSTAGGNYQFENLPSSIDITTARIVVEAIAGQTIDEDKPGVKITKAFTLSSPPGKVAFVSPITTMIDVQMKNTPSLSSTDAEILVKQKLNISTDTEVELFDDYVDNKQQSDNAGSQAEYQRLHQIAQSVTHAIASNLDEIENSASPVDRDFDEMLAAVVDKITDDAELITDVIDQAIGDNNTDIDPENIAEQLKDQLQLDPDKVADAIDAIEDKRDADIANMQTVLTQANGLFFMESDVIRDFQAEDRSCNITTELSYGNFSYNIANSASTWALSGFDPKTASFASIAEREESNYILDAAGNWQLNSQTDPSVIKFIGDNVQLALPSDGDKYISAKAINLAGKTFAKVLYDEDEWAKYVDHSQTFSQGAIAYSLTMEQVADHYMIDVWTPRAADEPQSEGCEANWAINGNCNVVRLRGNSTLVTNYNELMNPQWDQQQPEQMKLFNLISNEKGSLYVAMIEDATAGQDKATAVFYGEKAGNAGLTLKGQGTWQDVRIGEAGLIRFDMPAWLFNQYRDHVGNAFIALQDGAIRVGEFTKAGTKERDELAMNKAALDELSTALSQHQDFGNPDSTLEETTNAIECGYWFADNNPTGTK